MTGKEIRPMEITAAATTPVVAAKSAPTRITAMRQATAHRAEHLAHGLQQILCHAASLQDDAHEREEGNGQQGVVLHDAEDAQRQRLE
jgi:hypothetical protein